MVSTLVSNPGNAQRPLAATMLSTPDVLYFPFHDVRKWDREGWRTRDAHICRELLNEWGPSGISVADRPTCLAELARLSFMWRAQGRTLRSAPDRKSVGLGKRVEF